MKLVTRTLRASWLLVLVFASYAWQLGLEWVLPRSTRLRERRERLHEGNATRLLRGILKLGGVYIKFGQVLSVMVGLLPAAYRTRLATLQDRVPPRPFSEMQRAFIKSLGKLPGHCFRDIEDEPVAAASLGQVHAAHLQDGTKVAVKILYPGIRDTIRVDMRVLRFALWLFERFFPIGNLDVVHASLVDLLARETDYLHEAECMRRMADNFRDEPDILVPEPVMELTSRDVLTMRFMEGTKITDVDALRAHDIEPEAVGRRLLQCFFKQLFVHRYFHADPHPGNFLVQAGGASDAPQIVVLDFGAVSEAREGLVEGLIEALTGFFTKDQKRLLGGFERMGFVAEQGDRALVERTVTMYFERLVRIEHRTPMALQRARPGELRRLLDPELELRELRTLARSFRHPEGWFYIERSLVMMFGLCGTIAPELDMLKVGFPYVMPLLQAQSAKTPPA
jgi:predicted unusual protein kinase regulating ubiquinone biosynthesis (AarF/ABC1/UbiB family)